MCVSAREMKCDSTSQRERLEGHRLATVPNHEYTELHSMHEGDVSKLALIHFPLTTPYCHRRYVWFSSRQQIARLSMSLQRTRVAWSQRGMVMIVSSHIGTCLVFSHDLPILKQERQTSCRYPSSSVSPLVFMFVQNLILSKTVPVTT